MLEDMMSQVKIYGIPLGNIGANCYFVVNEETKEVVCIDTGAQGDTICEVLQKNDWKLSGILLTHGHADHIGAVSYVKSQLGNIPVYAGKQEEEVLANPDLNLTTMFGHTESLQVDFGVEDGQMIEIASMKFTCIETPGHTKGGICYYLKEEHSVFTGDTLFCQSIGRTDFPTGDQKQLEESIRTKLYVLPDDTIVYPGHDSKTTIGYEKQQNMFVRG